MPGQLTLVPVGPLTNIALAVLKDPGIVPLVKEVVIMGGSISEGNVTAAAEANVYNDPEAAQVVFDAGWKVTWWARRHPPDHFGRSTGAAGPDARYPERFRHTGHEVPDRPVGEVRRGARHARSARDGRAIDPSFVKTRHMRIDVETRGQFTRGATVGNRHNAVEHNELQGDRYVMTGIDRVQPNAWVAVEVDADRFLSFFIDRLAGK